MTDKESLVMLGMILLFLAAICAATLIVETIGLIITGLECY